MRFVKLFAMLFVTGMFVSLPASQHAVAQTVPFLIVGSGDIPEGLSLIPGESRPHTSVGYATSVGFHRGQGSVQIIDFLSQTTAAFKSGTPYKFTSILNRRDTLACNYGTVDATPGASEPGSVTLYPVDPENGIFYAIFIAEFTPALAECTGKFSRLRDGNFLMYARTEPFQVVGADAVAVPSDADGIIQYSWIGVGSLRFARR